MCTVCVGVLLGGRMGEHKAAVDKEESFFRGIIQSTQNYEFPLNLASIHQQLQKQIIYILLLGKL